MNRGSSDRSSRNRSGRSRSRGGWRRAFRRLVGHEAATDDRRKAWHKASTRGKHVGNGRRRRRSLKRRLCECKAAANKKVGGCPIPSWPSKARTSDESERVSNTNAPALLCPALLCPALLCSHRHKPSLVAPGDSAWATVQHPRARLSKTRQLDRDLPHPVTTPLTAEADLDRPHRGTTRDLAQTTATATKTLTSAHTPVGMTITNMTAIHTTVTRHTRATTKSLPRSASVLTGLPHLPKMLHPRNNLHLSSTTCQTSLPSMKPS